MRRYLLHILVLCFAAAAIGCDARDESWRSAQELKGLVPTVGFAGR